LPERIKTRVREELNSSKRPGGSNIFSPGTIFLLFVPFIPMPGLELLPLNAERMLQVIIRVVFDGHVVQVFTHVMYGNVTLAKEVVAHYPIALYNNRSGDAFVCLVCVFPLLGYLSGLRLFAFSV
jgi:hypothetical protein